jgi:hypothetical protein
MRSTDVRRDPAISCALLLLAACATSGEDLPADAGTGGFPDGATAASGSCPEGEFATGVAGDGSLLCAPIDGAAGASLTEHCSLFFGQSDNCDGCTSLPEKWGRISGIDCDDALGVDNSCTTADLGGVSLPLFGLDLEGDVNDDDKLHLGMQCAIVADEPMAGPCPPGAFLSGIGDGAGECVTARAAIVDYLRGGCDIYFGWRDNCSGCGLPPTKWGRTGSAECTVGAGADSTCTSFRLGEDAVQTFGLNPDGDVDSNDAIYLGFQCGGAVASESTRAGSCPVGELVVGIEPGGQVQCASPLPAAEAAVQDGCFLYIGQRDNCSGCTTPPTKWGRISHTVCDNGAGAGNTCTTATLGESAIELFGLDIDGDMDENDKLYLGLSCPSLVTGEPGPPDAW